jgi:gluconolactonase
MNHTLFLLSVLICGVLSSVMSEVTYGDEVKTSEVKILALTIKVPDTWERQEPSNRMRLAQFAVPAVGDDKEDGELTVYNFSGGGSERSNVDRWLAQFQSEGRKANVTRGVAPLGKYVCVDVQGTYNKSVGPPILRKTTPVPGSRMLAVMLSLENDGNYFLKLTGPKATVTAAEKAFRASFGGKSDSEKPFEFE